MRKQELERQGELDLRSSGEKLQDLERELRELRENLWCVRCEVPRGAMLSDKDIKRLILQGVIKIDPLPNLEDPAVLGTCKVDLHLGAEALILDTPRVAFIDFSKPIPEEYFRRMNLQTDGDLVIRPNEVIICVALEKVTLPDCLTGRLEGKSSIARKGGSVQAAPIFDAGWSGCPMLELHNIGGVAAIAHYGQPICAMSFHHLSSPTLRGYAQRDGVKYASQTSARM